ncbi:hypothetical protein BH18ACT7_BH18ACT7_24660 [soil metagenome]
MVELCNVARRTLVELRLSTAEDGDLGDTGPVQAALDLTLPGPGRTSQVGGRLAVWLGPGWWLLDDRPDESGGLEAGLVHPLRATGPRTSAVDVSAGFVVLELTGPSAAEVLAHGCSIDLHRRSFGPGSSARTMLAKAQVVLARPDDGPTYRIWVRTSFSRYLVEWLLDAAVEYR